MGLLDGPMRSVAEILTQKLGATATLIRENTDYDFEEDENSERDADRWDNVPITPLENLQTSEAYDVFRAAGSTVAKGDMATSVPAKYLTDNSIPTPEIGWQVLVGGAQYRVKNVAPEMSGDLAARYLLHCGR